MSGEARSTFDAMHVPVVDLSNRFMETKLTRPSVDYRVPFNRPALAGNEFELMRLAVESGQLSANGIYSRRAEAMLQTIVGAPTMLTTSCTHALEMAAILLDVREGDEVIVPSFTFVSCANAFALRGATPVFVDVLPDSLNVNPAEIREAITPRTRAMVVVHYAGIPCDMKTICTIAQEHSVPIIEDNAHGLFGRYRNRALGSFGRFATLSFHETKNVQCGEGGALVLNDERDIKRAEIIRDKGTNRQQFMRGQLEKYQWVGLGSSYAPSEILAAFLVAQLEELETIQYQRRVIWERYDREIGPLARELGYAVPVVPENADITYHIYYLMLKTQSERDDCIHFLKQEGIEAVFHYQPLHLSPYAVGTKSASRPCLVAASAGHRLVRLPLFNGMTVGQQGLVIKTLRRFLSR